MKGPVGPLAFNGSQGAADLTGDMEPRRLKEAVSFSSWQYKVEAGYFTPRNPSTLASKTEPTVNTVDNCTFYF